MQHFDAIVIGTGTAGQTAAADLAAAGYEVAIAENSPTPGGVCALRGCQAKKWFYEAAETVARSRHLLGRGILKEPQVSWKQIVSEKNSFTEKIPQGTRDSLQGNEITYLEGLARFVDKNTLQVGASSYTARYIIIATGAVPRNLSFPGAEFLATSDDFLDLPTLPQRIAFLGGGFISFEFAHFAARLGCDGGNVHILEAGERPLGPFDKDLVLQLVAASQSDGINILTKVDVTSIEKREKGCIVHFSSGDFLEVDLVVNGTGRIANIASLQLDKAGIKATEKGINVDHAMRTSNPFVYAVGDCAQSIMLARVADMEGHIAAQAVSAQDENKEMPAIDYSEVPAVLFTYPQLGMVGKTEEQLQQENIRYWKSYDTRLSWPTYRRIGMKHAAYKILIDENSHILGAHFLGDNTTGLLNTFKQAMLDRTPLNTLHRNNIMSPYPSRESDILYMLAPLLD
ncbi:MAG: NAD(P)/FAD-dependent oxidoreductase [Desulfopila sp.]|jgi:glutathione reductase (NADPH)|nr:NAD(P)/FAD-dependent oxidoreductase [Desulfopila sp.]